MKACVWQSLFTPGPLVEESLLSVICLKPAGWRTGVMENWSTAFVLSLRVTGYALRVMHIRV
jgi:hypothetical protein